MQYECLQVSQCFSVSYFPPLYVGSHLSQRNNTNVNFSRLFHMVLPFPVRLAPPQIPSRSFSFFRALFVSKNGTISKPVSVL